MEYVLVATPQEFIPPYQLYSFPKTMAKLRYPPPSEHSLGFLAILE